MNGKKIIAKELIEKLSESDTYEDTVIDIGVVDERCGIGCIEVMGFDNNITLFPVRIKKWWIED